VPQDFRAETRSGRARGLGEGFPTNSAMNEVNQYTLDNPVPPYEYPVANGDSMGLIAKQKTKKRVAPALGISRIPNAKDAPWTTHGKVLAGAIVRATALGLDVRGRQSSGMNQKLARIFYTTKTSLRVEATGSSTWEVTLGPYGKPEWRCEIAVRKDGDVSVRTIRYSTMEDQLINGDLHDVFRYNILEAMASGTVAGTEAESDISLLSLDSALLTDAVAALGALTDSFTVMVDKSVDQVEDQIASAGFARLHRGGMTRWGLGLPAYFGENFVDVAIHEATLGDTAAGEAVSRRVVVGDIRLGGSGPRATQVFAAQAASSFVDSVKGVLMRNQENASFTPPQVLSGRWSS
jgi:hypothetical protein